MRIFALVLLLCIPSLADHTVTHGGRAIVTFDVPEVEYRGQKEGKDTRTFFSIPIGNGNLKITVRSKGWMSELKAEQRYSDDRRDKRRDQEARLEDSVELKGALKTLVYSTSSPYIAKTIVIYTKDFRCELMVTGTEEAGAQIEPTFEQLVKTLKVVPRTNIGELKIGD
jgi:hypothetical protein